MHALLALYWCAAETSKCKEGARTAKLKVRISWRSRLRMMSGLFPAEECHEPLDKGGSMLPSSHRLTIARKSAPRVNFNQALLRKIAMGQVS